MDFTQLLEVFNIDVAMIGILAVLGVFVNLATDGIVSTFNVTDGVKKRLIMVFVVVATYTMYLYRDIEFVRGFIIPLITLFAIATGMHKKSADKKVDTPNIVEDVKTQVDTSVKEAVTNLNIMLESEDDGVFDETNEVPEIISADMSVGE